MLFPLGNSFAVNNIVFPADGYNWRAYEEETCYGNTNVSSGTNLKCTVKFDYNGYCANDMFEFYDEGPNGEILVTPSPYEWYTSEESSGGCNNYYWGEVGGEWTVKFFVNGALVDTRVNAMYFLTGLRRMV